MHVLETLNDFVMLPLSSEAEFLCCSLGGWTLLYSRGAGYVRNHGLGSGDIKGSLGNFCLDLKNMGWEIEATSGKFCPCKNKHKKPIIILLATNIMLKIKVIYGTKIGQSFKKLCWVVINMWDYEYTNEIHSESVFEINSH